MLQKYDMELERPPQTESDLDGVLLLPFCGLGVSKEEEEAEKENKFSLEHSYRLRDFRSTYLSAPRRTDSVSREVSSDETKNQAAKLDLRS